MPSGISNLSDTDFLAMVTNFLTEMSANMANYPGVTAAMVTSLDGQKDAFNTSLNDHVTAQATAQAKRIAKDDQRSSVEGLIRQMRDLTKASGVTDANFANLGLPTNSAAAPNATVPVGEVDTSERMRHTITFYEKEANGNRRRPRGAVGCEIWVKVGDPAPGSEKECTFLGLDTATPYVAEYESDDANKTAHYLLRWQMRDGSKGAWGETVSATITA